MSWSEIDGPPVAPPQRLKVFAGERTWIHRVLRPLEVVVYKTCGIDEAAEQRWTGYAGGILIFSLVTIVITYAMLRIQQWLATLLRDPVSFQQK